VNAFAKAVTAKIEPAEKRLMEMETFAERAEARRKAQLKLTRETQLCEMGVDTQFYDLANMPDQAFADLMTTSRITLEQRIAAERKAKEDAIAENNRKVEEARKMKEENERLRMEQARKDQAYAAQLAQQREESARRDEQARKEREAQEQVLAHERRTREAAEAAARKEREDRLREETARKLAEEKARKVAEKAKWEAERAPDKEKVVAYIKAIMAVPTPVVTDAACKITLENLTSDINYYMEGAEKL